MINIKDIPLLKAFIDRDSLDYIAHKSDEWKLLAYNLIIKEIEKHDNINYITISSSSNLGYINTSLKISTTCKYKGVANMDNLEIYICPCGNIKHLITSKLIKPCKN